MLRILIAAALALAPLPAYAVTKVFTWTWPTVRTDGTALPLSGIGGVTLYDTAVAVPNQPGTVVPCPATIPPTTATGTCSANVTSGHSFVVTTQDTATPPDISAPSNSVIVPFTAPAAITDLKVQ
jgi:hypothetical protein